MLSGYALIPALLHKHQCLIAFAICDATCLIFDNGACIKTVFCFWPSSALDKVSYVSQSGVC